MQNRRKEANTPPILSLFSLLSPRSLCGEADQPNSRLADTQDKRRKAQHRRGIGGRLTVGKGCAKISILWRQAEINRAISETK